MFIEGSVELLFKKEAYFPELRSEIHIVRLLIIYRVFQNPAPDRRTSNEEALTLL